MPRMIVGAHVELVGWHSWPAAEGLRGYLGNLHRHRFHIEVEVEVAEGSDRQVEFHDLMDEVVRWWGPERDQRDRGSCEAMAYRLYGYLLESGLAVAEVRVGEDGEAWVRCRTE